MSFCNTINACDGGPRRHCDSRAHETTEALQTTCISGKSLGKKACICAMPQAPARINNRKRLCGSSCLEPFSLCDDSRICIRLASNADEIDAIAVTTKVWQIVSQMCAADAAHLTSIFEHNILFENLFLAERWPSMSFALTFPVFKGSTHRGLEEWHSTNRVVESCCTVFIELAKQSTRSTHCLEETRLFCKVCIVTADV